jgi:hypothetical protein
MSSALCSTFWQKAQTYTKRAIKARGRNHGQWLEYWTGNTLLNPFPMRAQNHADAA